MKELRFINARPTRHGWTQLLVSTGAEESRKALNSKVKDYFRTAFWPVTIASGDSAFGAKSTTVVAYLSRGIDSEDLLQLYCLAGVVEVCPVSENAITIDLSDDGQRELLMASLRDINTFALGHARPPPLPCLADG